MIPETKTGDGLAALREAVFDDFHLLLALRPIRDRDAFIERLVAVAASRGFVVDKSEILAEMRSGEDWLT